MPASAVNGALVVGTELEKVRTKIGVLYESDDRFYSSIEKKNVEVVSNRQMRAPLQLRPGGNFGYFDPDGGDLGRGGGPTWDKAVLSPVFMKEGFEYTKLAQWSTDDSRKAVIDAVRKMISGGLTEMERQTDAQLQGSGNGVVGVSTVYSTAAGVDTVTLANTFGARLVRFGQEVQVYDTTLGTLKGTSTITFWDVANRIVKLTPAVASGTAGDKLVVTGITAPTALPALYGVAYHDSNASTGTWLGFDRSNTPEIRANGVNASSAALTLPLPRLAMNLIGNRIGIDNTMKPIAWMHPAQVQAYEEIGQLVSIIQKTAKAEGLNMYFGEEMQMAGAQVKPHFNWDTSRIDFIDGSNWGRGEILPIGFYRTDGREIFEIRGSSGGVATADIFYMCVGFQTFVENPAGISYIYGLAVPTGY